MVINKQQNGIRINYMALPKLHMKIMALIGGKERIIRGKDMEHLRGLVETDTLGSTCRMSNMGMEYSDGQMELYTEDNGNKISKKVMHMPDGQMAMSIMDSTRIISKTEKESDKKKAFYTQLNMNKTR